MMSDIESEAKTKAEHFRTEHGLGVQPLTNLAVLIEKTTGIGVALIATADGSHGLKMRDPLRDRTLIAVAKTPHYMRQRSTLAHELGHALFGDSIEILGERSSKERRADSFARHLLIPAGGLHALLRKGEELTLQHLSEVVQHFLVSPQMACIALQKNGFINQETVESWWALTTEKLANRFGWADQYKALQAESDQTRVPQNLLKRAIDAYSKGLVSAQIIATLRGVDLETALADLSEIDPNGTFGEERIKFSELPDVDIDLSELD